MSETARAAGRRRVHGVAREARVLPCSPAAHHLVVGGINTGPSNPVRDIAVQGSYVLNDAQLAAEVVIRGTTLLHIEAPLQTVFRACLVGFSQPVAIHITARVFEEVCQSVPGYAS